MPNGKIIIAGSFTSYNGIDRNRIARLNQDGFLDLTFDPGEGANNTITSLTIQDDGSIIVSGYFSSYDGTPRNRIARVLNNTSNTSIAANSFENSVVIYPNPADHLVAFENILAGLTVRIIDINGKELQSIVAEGNQIKINTEYLANGIYFSQVVDKYNNTIVKKFVVSK